MRRSARDGTYSTAADLMTAYTPLAFRATMRGISSRSTTKQVNKREKSAAKARGRRLVRRRKFNLMREENSQPPGSLVSPAVEHDEVAETARAAKGGNGFRRIEFARNE